jgi:hypothetical protein
MAEFYNAPADLPKKTASELSGWPMVSSQKKSRAEIGHECFSGKPQGSKAPPYKGPSGRSALLALLYLVSVRVVWDQLSLL